MENIIIRNSTSDDARAIIELKNYMWEKTYRNLLPVHIFEKQEKEKENKVKGLEEKLKEDNSLHFVVEKDVIIVGLASAREQNDKGMGEEIPQINAMYFKENIQGFGISLELAKVIVKKFLDNCLKIGYLFSRSRQLEQELLKEI